jgi:CRP/FNR family transcriptional regulator, cyclic AMP receptor protein
MNDTTSEDISSDLGDPSTFMPFKTGSGYYDPAVAKAFFKAFGQKEQIAAGITIFVEHEKSNKQTLFGKPIAKALTTPLTQDLFKKSNIHRMFLLTKGEVALTAGGKLLETVRPGDVFGEMAVISEIPDIDTAAKRSATAQASTDCVAYSLDGSEAQAGLAKQPEFALMLMSVMFARLRFLAARLDAGTGDRKQHSLRSVPLFDAEMLAALRDRLEDAMVLRYANEAKIIKAGSKGNCMYVVLEGKVGLTIGKKMVEKLGPGGVFGEMALVDQSPRTASALARTECALLSINRDALISMVKSDPAFGMALMRTVAGRLRYMNSLFA